MRSNPHRPPGGGGGIPLFAAIVLAVGVNLGGYMAWRSSAATSATSKRAVVSSPAASRSSTAAPRVATAAAPHVAPRVAAAAPARPAVVAVAPPAVSRSNASVVVTAPRAAVPAPRAAAVPRSAPPPPAAAQTVRTSVPIVSYPEWNNAQKLNIADPPTAVSQRVAATQDWSQAAPLLGLDTRELFSRALVEPYCRGQRNPDLSEFGSLNGKQGRVTVHCTLSADGRPSVQISPSGDATLDRVAYKLGNETMWLPAMRYGKPVDYTFDYVMVFAACDYH